MKEFNESIGEIIATDYTIKLDKINQKLLSLLMNNARTQYSKLANILNISKSNIIRRISNLENKKVISGYHTFIDVSELGLNSCLLLIQTKCTENQKDYYLKQILDIPNVYSLVELTGKFDILIAFNYKNEDHRDNSIEKIVTTNLIRDFSIFNVKTYFPKLDYTLEMFTIKKQDIGNYSKLFHKKKEQRAIDKMDIKILKLLSKNCRFSLTEMSKELKISRETVNYRIKKLILGGVIAKFQPTINLFSLGFESYFLMLKLSKPTQKSKLINYLKETHRCNTIIKSDGAWDLMTFIHFKNNKEFRSFENNLISKFKEVIHEYSFELIKHQYKLDWFSNEIGELLTTNM